MTSTTAPSFEKGLVEVADGVFAYLQPDGTWGWSNAGLVVGDGESTLVDTLFDLHLTGEMLDAMQRHTGSSPISQVINTHANGDHCYGNQMVDGPGVDFIVSEATAQEMTEVPASLLGAMVDGAGEGVLGDFVRSAFGAFDFDGIDVPPPTIEFSGSLDLDAGGREVRLTEVGPAHTAGDVLAWLPDERVLFAGDILFIGGTPIMWAGPVDNWIAACDLIEQLDPEVIVPGHGPLTDLAGVRNVRDYFVLLRDMTVERHAAGLSVEDTVADIDHAINGGGFAHWTDRERIVVTVRAIWRGLDPGYEPPDALTTFQLMADHAAGHR